MDKAMTNFVTYQDNSAHRAEVRKVAENAYERIITTYAPGLQPTAIPVPQYVTGQDAIQWLFRKEQEFLMLKPVRNSIIQPNHFTKYAKDFGVDLLILSAGWKITAPQPAPQ